MKKLIVFCLVVGSISAMAEESHSRSSKKLIASCRDVGVAKVLQKAQAQKLNITEEDVFECGVDNRPLNTSKYVWFCGTDSNGEMITALTQKPSFRKCF